MITLDQVLLLQEKVESAVEKIAQLEEENDSLRVKCMELSDSLSSKTERIASLEAELASLEKDQSKIEAGILQALDKLNAIENSVLKAGEAADEKLAQETQEKDAKKDDAEKELDKNPSKASGLAQQAEEVKKSDEGGQFDIF